jgi:UDP-N-acetyl-D-mannosaminuronate dehydrogenase
MPAYAARRAQNILNEAGLATTGANVLLLGVTYKANIADERESPAVPLARDLHALGAKISYHDPHVRNWKPGVDAVHIDDLHTAVAEADLVILVQNHRAYDADNLAGTAKRFFDTRGVTRSDRAFRL